MEFLLQILGLAIAVAVLVYLAFPAMVIPDTKPRKRKVGSTYWGVYEGLPATEPEEARTIEIHEAGRKEKTIAGSQMYSAGRGTSFRQ